MTHTSNVQSAPRFFKQTKADIILDLLMSLNRGDCGTIADRPYYAIEQYNRLVKSGVIAEETSYQDERANVNVSDLFRPPVGPP